MSEQTDAFDWAGLWEGASKAWDHRPPFVPREEGDRAAAAYLRTRIEAAFVPVERYNERGEAFFQASKLLIEATARAEAAEARNRRTLTDTQRLIWRDDVEGICPSPDMCFEYGGHVRCGPCAIKQSLAQGVEPDMSLPNLPEVSRLRREIEALTAQLAEARESERAAVERSVKLWALLDDIDTLDDACRSEDDLFRTMTRSAQQKRHSIMSGEEWDAIRALDAAAIAKGE